jgi:GrpB-like predicted nucleotidyltransferase (UPF0157 family)
MSTTYFNGCAVTMDREQYDNITKSMMNLSKDNQRLLEENKSWETRFMKLTEDLEEVSAIAQAQAKVLGGK